MIAQKDIDWKAKEAIIHVIQELVPKINEVKQLQAPFEEFLVNAVLPELNSSNPFMKVRAC